MKQTIYKRLAIAAVALILSACGSDALIITGTVLPPTNPAKIRIYSTPPASFREIAIIKAENDGQPDTPHYSSADRMLNQLKSVAASLGANAVLIRDFTKNNGGIKGNNYGLSSAYGSDRSEPVRSSSSSRQEGIHGVAIFVLSEEEEI